MADTFKYLRFSLSDDRKMAVFEYELTHDEKKHFLKESLEFDVALGNSAAVNNALRALHLALGISYYKTFLPSQIVQPYAMDEAEAMFWNDTFVNGLGEFLYVNKLPAEKIARFKSQTGEPLQQDNTSSLDDSKALLGIGGGKDSIVAGEALKNIGLKVDGFVMATGEQLGQSQAVAETMAVPLHPVKRLLDPLLLELQEEPGAFKGHIPISLIFGFVGTLVALSNNMAYVVVANEASSSIPGVNWNGKAVNHQWSKSFELEQKLQAYIKNYIAKDLTYFSAIRPLSSVAVARKFAKLPQYFEVFTSDNFVFRIDPARRPNARWSLESPKSLSSFILLAPWLDESDMLRIFSRDFLNEASLENLLLELTGVKGQPPLDCVGTVDELVLSLNLASEQNKFVDTKLMKVAKQSGVVRDGDWQTKLSSMLSPAHEEAYPDKIRTVLEREVKR